MQIVPLSGASFDVPLENASKRCQILSGKDILAGYRESARLRDESYALLQPASYLYGAKISESFGGTKVEGTWDSLKGEPQEVLTFKLDDYMLTSIHRDKLRPIPSPELQNWHGILDSEPQYEHPAEDVWNSPSRRTCSCSPP